jgi:sulfide:quinone oxidoreductase
MSGIVVAGSGFGGCTAVRALRRGGYAGPITLISPAPRLFYYPSLIWVPSGGRTRAELEVPLEGFFRRHRVTYRPGSVTGLDPGARRLVTDAGEVPYDYLIVASGGRYLRKLPGIEHAHVACAGWEPTHAFSERLAALEHGRVAFGFSTNPNEPVAVRGGPVFEFLLGVDTLLRRQGRRERFTLTFFSPAARPGARMGEKAVDQVLGEMARRGIETHLGHKLRAIEPHRVLTEGGEVASDLTLFIPGLTGPAWAGESGLPLSPGGFLAADAHCRVAGPDGPVDRVYVAGDAGSFPGPDWMPKQAHMADLQATAAARNVIERLAGRPDQHTFRTELICIVDTLTGGTLVYRDLARGFTLSTRALHWAKAAFEWQYLRPYRRSA